MGRKSRKRAMIKPFCYFCSREFDNEKVLIQHQKAKHFKCGECNRKLETAHGLLVHMQQVHKMVQRNVPNAMEGRDNINSMIQGMNGIPLDVIEDHQLRHTQKMGDMNNRKQQRINWTQVAMAPSVEQFVSQMRTGNTYFPGFTSGTDSNKANALVNGHSTTTSAVEKDFGGYKPITNTNVSTQPLILGPSGVPIEAPVNNVSQSKSRFTAAPPINLLSRTDAPQIRRGFSDANVQPIKRGFSDASSAPSIDKGFSDAGTPSIKRGFEDANVPLVRKGFDENNIPQVRKGFSDPNQTVNTVLYKNSGVAPLFIPTPALSNTKLSYSSDSVSIEELRAKIRYNWHEGM